MRHACQKPLRAHHRHPQQDVRQVADRRKCKPSLKMRLLHRHGRTIEDTEHGDAHNHKMHPCPPDQLCAETVIGQPHDCKGAGFDHCHCMQKRRHRSGRYRCLRKPALEREHSRFYAKPPEGQQINDLHDGDIVADPAHIQNTAHDKIRRSSKDNDKHQRHKSKCRTADGIIQVNPAGVKRLLRHGMHDQIHRYQR